MATLLALVFLNAVLLLPPSPSALTADHFLAIAIELPLIVAILFVTPRVLRWPVTALVVAVLAITSFLSIANIMTQLSLGRFFKPLVDSQLFGAGWDVLSGAVGETRALLITVAAIAGFLLLMALVWWAVGRLFRLGQGWRGQQRLAAAGLPAVAVALVFGLGIGRGSGIPVDDQAWERLSFHTRQIVSDLESRREFAGDLAEDSLSALPAEAQLSRLEGRDVLLVFIESYGRSALDDARYRPVVAPALGALGEAVRAADAHAVSGWLTSPVAGGQSWLAHGSLLSGLWLDTQRRYDQLVTSDRETLVHLFDAAGWRTTAIMPALTLAWPEGHYFGYDRLYDADDLGYAGRPFNWVTMPDQYTLTALNRLELDPAPRDPVFAEVALISSHAPWTPIAPVIDWADVGDGSIFSQWADTGDPPAVLWRDFDRVREHYALSIAYSLEVVAGYIETFLDEEDLLIVLGDHQAAPLITGEGASRAVPMHVISRDPRLIEAIADWGWTPGVAPTAETPEWPMSAFRARFVEAYSDTGHVVANAGGESEPSTP